MTGPGSLSQMARVVASIPADTPIADRWHQLGEDIEQHGRDIDAVRATHRDDCLSRYGFDIFACPPSLDDLGDTM